MTTSAGNASRFRFWMSTGLLLSVVCLSACRPASDVPRLEVSSFAGPTMGTRYSVSIVTKSPQSVLTAIQEQVDTRLAEINRQMSTYDAESELSKFNQTTGNDWFAVSAETVLVIEFALKVAVDSGGAFDPTVGPAVNLWGFGPEKDQVLPPAEADIAMTLADVGFDKVEVRRDPPALRKSVPGLYVDLSAIAKGYAVDEISALLDKGGYSSSMVEIGGEVRTRGTKPGDKLWQIGVETPNAAGRSLQKVIELRDAALATSGDYRNFFEYEGVRYSHTIDPHTGRPVLHNMAAVSVIADTCMQADAWATALLVMGDELGYDWCVANEVAALFLVRRDQEIVEHATPEFQKLLDRQK